VFFGRFLEFQYLEMLTANAIIMAEENVLEAEENMNPTPAPRGDL